MVFAIGLKILVTLILLGFRSFVFASQTEDEIVLEKVQITGRAFLYPLERVSQEISVIPKIFLERGVGLHSAVDLRERGGYGVQEDLSIRGTNFEQNLVLIEGLRISDLQTGHHIMNLPILNQNLRSIEVLTGGASPIYGASGFGGAINYILDEPKKFKVSASANLASYDYKDYALNLSYPSTHLPFSLSFQQKKIKRVPLEPRF